MSYFLIESVIPVLKMLAMVGEMRTNDHSRYPEVRLTLLRYEYSQDFISVLKMLIINIKMRTKNFTSYNSTSKIYETRKTRIQIKRCDCIPFV